jgi:hypothetical protein
VDRPVLERVADTMALGNADIAKLIQSLRDPSSPAPTTLPEVVKDAKQPAFVRSNLALYFAKQCVNRRVHDESLEALKLVRPEFAVDPASYYFFKAVAENKLVLRDEGLQSVDRLLHSVAETPERYQVLANLMKAEMERWKDKDLGYISRRMDDIEDRLDNARGGPKTQEKQKEVIDLLDKTIEEIEQQMQQMMQMAQGSNAQKSSMPLPDSKIIGGAGPGNVDKRKLLQDLQVWGRMPEKERIKAMEAIARDLPPQYREAIEGYLKELAKGTASKK